MPETMKENFHNPETIVSTITSIKDIELLKESNILHLLPIGVSVCDASGYIRYHNSKAKEIWGRIPNTDDEHFGGAYKIYDAGGNIIQQAQSPFAICLIDGVPRNDMELIVERPDHSRVNVKCSIVPIKDENNLLVGMLNCFYDISVQKQLINHNVSLEKMVESRTSDLVFKNEELRKSEEIQHKMIEEVEDYAIILLDKNGIIQNWNKGAEKIKGYRENEIVGKNFRIFYRDEDRLSGLPERLIEEARQKGKALHEGWRIRKDGTKFWGSIVLTSLHDNDNNVIGFSKVTRDLTERKLAEDKLKDYTTKLEFQKQELEQFAYAASHDMKEPLRKIHFYNSFIQENSGHLLEGKSKEYLERSINAVKRMDDLIEDLLTYSRTSSSDENYEEIDLNEMIDELVLPHKEEYEQKKIKIEIGKLPNIRVIPFQFKQLLENLLNNAVKYRKADKETIIQIKSKKVKGSLVKNKETEPNRFYHKISVIDNGIGFDPQYSEKVFEIFQRLTNFTGVKGTGIGLAICKKIAQNHKGFIFGTGKINQGATFDIYIPVDL